jgi:hypothetical protein
MENDGIVIWQRYRGFPLVIKKAPTLENVGAFVLSRVIESTQIRSVIR